MAQFLVFARTTKCVRYHYALGVDFPNAEAAIVDAVCRDLDFTVENSCCDEITSEKIDMLIDAYKNTKDQKHHAALFYLVSVLNVFYLLY